MPNAPRNYFSGAFHNVVNVPAFTAAHKALLPAGPRGHFTGDNLIAFSRSLSFLDDQPFMNAFNGAGPDGLEKSLIWRLHTLVWAARRAMKLDGDFVEAAVYRGFAVRVIGDALNFKASGRRYWAYDMFDVPVGDKLYLKGHGPDLFAQVKRRLEHIPNVHLIKGRIPEAFQQGEPERIAFLHLDMNNAAAEMATLERLFDRIAPGGVIVLDDFGFADYEEQRIAETKFFADRGLHVLELPTSQGLVIK